MRVVIQRVNKAAVWINGIAHAAIGKGLVVLLGIEKDDTTQEAVWLSQKIVNMRIFEDEDGLMNLSVKDTDGEILLISQFTLHADASKGNRPSFIRAAKPQQAIQLYEEVSSLLNSAVNKPVKAGVFGADMQVELVNDGPVTIILDSKRGA